MLISGILNISATTLFSNSFMNPLRFPLAQVLTYLVFDSRLTNYNVKLIAQETFKSEKNIGPYGVACFSFQYIRNIKTLEKMIKGRGSIVLEFVYFDIEMTYPLSKFFVIREDAYGNLVFYNH